MEIVVVYKAHDHDNIIGICDNEESAKKFICDFHSKHDRCDKMLNVMVGDGDGYKISCSNHRYFAEWAETNRTIFGS